MSSTITCRPLRLNYFLRIPNVGDRINPALVTGICNRPTTYIAGTTEPHLIAAGSTMSAATPASHVWGTGVMHPDFGVGHAQPSNIHAVRGKLTHSTLRNAGIEVADIPLGDPGYLAPSLLGVAKTSAPTKTIGIVPHYVDRRNPHFRRLMAEPDVMELNVHDDPEEFLRNMALCKTVISSSLHGLIFAEALGIPNLWVTAGDEIAGGPFKFNDWFSTSAKPQKEAHVLNPDDRSCELAGRASLHDCLIDAKALKASFPMDRLDELCESKPRVLVPVADCRSRPIPAFLISFNRGAMLEKSIHSIKRLNRPTEIVIQDNGSTDDSTLEVLAKLEKSGTRVVRHGPITSADDLNQVNDTVQDFFSKWAEPSRYIVSDCDIDMAISAAETLDVYDELLNSHRQVECVGPMLKISDIPQLYPLYNRVINRHVEQFWHKQPEWSETSFGPVAHLACVIDTTFALQRSGETYRRLKQALRVYEPYEAQHLDWYIEQMGDIYSTTSNAAISHWNNSAELEVHQHVDLDHDRYYVVRRNQAGILDVCEERLGKRNSEDPCRSQAGPILPFCSAPETQRRARISHTEELQRTLCTDVERWSHAASHYDCWRERGKLLAGFVRPGERVFEFGAGNSVVAEALPVDCTYVGSDAVPIKADVVKFDLNAPTLPRLLGHDVGLFSGVLEYVHDLQRLAVYLAQNFGAVVCSYAVLTGSSTEELARRRYSGWFSDLSQSDFCAVFRGAGFRLIQDGNWEGQSLFRWDRVRTARVSGRSRRGLFASSMGSVSTCSLE